MFKKFIVFVLCLAICLPVPVFALNYDIQAAYDECYTLYPVFVENVIAHGTTEEKIIVFMDDVRNYLLGLPEQLTEDNFDKHIYNAINAAFKYRRNIKVRDALMAAYPEAVTKAMDGIITEEFVPIYETIKRFILGITTPVVTLSGNMQELYVHHVRMPEDAMIIVAFYNDNGELIKTCINPDDAMYCNASYALAFAFKEDSILPLCDKYILKNTQNNI